MNTSTLLFCVFAALCAASLLVFVWCTWADLRDKDSGPDEEKRKDQK